MLVPRAAVTLCCVHLGTLEGAWCEQLSAGGRLVRNMSVVLIFEVLLCQ